MAAKKIKRSSRKIKSLPTKNVSAKDAKRVKGGSRIKVGDKPW